MANIQNELNNIKNAMFGKDVRNSIHDAIKQCYDDASVNNDNANMEVKLARGVHNTLNDRLSESDKKQKELSSQLAHIEHQQLNVKSFGAKGDGITDDLNSFNNTVDYAINNNIKKIILPSGKYILYDTFKLPSGFMLEGLGEVYIKQVETNSPVIATKEYYDNTRPYGRTKIININVIGSSSNGIDNHGILIWDYYVTLDNCNVSYCGGHGIFFTHKSISGTTPSGNLVESTIKNCHVRYTNLTPIKLGEDNNNKITDGVLENIMVSSNEGCDNDIRIGSSAGWFINNVHTYGKANQSIRLANCYNTSINNIYIENYIKNGLNIHLQTNVNINNISIKVQDSVLSESSAIKIDKSSLDVGSASCNINNISLFSYSTKVVLGVELINNLIKMNVDNYLVGGQYVENITKYGGYGKSNIKIKDGINLSKELIDDVYTLKYNNTRVKQYDIFKFSGSTEKIINLKIPNLNNYGKIIGKLSIYGNAYDNGTLLSTYSSDVFISAKSSNDEFVVYNKELIANSGFSVTPVLSVSKELSELIITFTPSDNRVTGVVSFDYCVI